MRITGGRAKETRRETTGKAMKLTKSQLAALRRYADATMDGTAPLLTGPGGSVRSGTHCALLRRGLLEVADLRPPRSVQHTYAYNFGRIRITKSHVECDSRFRLTDAGRAAINAGSDA